MSIFVEYERATRDAEIARLRRVLAVRALLAQGASQREVAHLLGVTQPAISYQVAPERTQGARPSELIAAGGAVLRKIAEERGFSELAAFGSAARGDDRPDSDVDLLVKPSDDVDLFDMARLEEVLEKVLGRNVDLVSYGGLDAKRDRDILRDKALL